MVEEMSGKNLALEDEVKTLAATNDELEEALELATEMEEVQAEELKAAMLEQQSSQTMVQNLQEAIRMQREKEKEFDGTVAKYKALVADLKAERDSLIASNSEALGDQGALIQKSQQVLAKAAKEAKILEEVRRKEQQMKKMRMDQPISEMQIATFKAFLPSEVSGLFTSALAGDVTLQVVCGTCALGLEDLFRLWDAAHDEEVSVDTKTAMGACEGDCIAGESFVNASMESYRVMLALGTGAIENTTEDELVEISAVAGGHFNEIGRLAMSVVEKINKSEGSVLAQDSELTFFVEAIQHAVSAMEGVSEKPLIPAQWKPLGWEQIRDVSVTECICSAICSHLLSFFSSEMAAKVQKLAGDSKKLTRALEAEVAIGALKVEEGAECLASAKALAAAIKANIESEDMSKISSALDVAQESLSKCLKSARSGAKGTHPISPKNLNSFESCRKYQEEIRAGSSSIWDGRAAKLQQKLLRHAKAEEKVAEITSNFDTTKASLDAKEKEIALLKVKVTQFEDLLSSRKQGTSSAGAKDDDQDNEGLDSLKKENGMLNQAIEVLHAQVEEYESELKILRGVGGKGSKTKSPMRGGRRSTVAHTVSQGGGLTSMDDASLLSDGAAEVFRPLLRAARLEAASWKNKVVVNAIEGLPPLRSGRGSINSVEAKLNSSQPQGGDNPEKTSRRFGRDELHKALSDLRLANAGSKVIDLGGSLEEVRKEKDAATRRLEEIVEECKWALKSWERPAAAAAAGGAKGSDLAARVTIKCAPGHGSKGVIVGTLSSRFELSQVMVPPLY